MNARDQLKKTQELLRLEKEADQEQYRQKVLLRPLHARVKEGVTWYPVKLKSDYIGTGERIIIEVERTSHHEQPHSFQSGKVVSVFSTAQHKPQRDYKSGVVNYVRDNLMVITLNGEDIPDWIDGGSLGVDVMFDEVSYREMEYALKKVVEAEENRLADLREILLGEKNSSYPSGASNKIEFTTGASLLNDSQRKALQKAVATPDVAFIHGPPGTGKTTTLVEAIGQTVKTEGQVLVCAPSNAAIDLLVEKLSDQNLSVLRLGHPARVTEQSLSKTLDARIAGHSHFGELRNLRKRLEHVKQQAGKYKRTYGFAEKNERMLLREEAKQLKSDADLLEFYITNDLLQSSDVIACTLVGSSHPTLRGRKFKTVFIDEAGQSLEPASWIPILKSNRVILAGDHKQLPPTIRSWEAAKQGLEKTLFEKGIEKHPETSVMLQVQYRMHEAIMQFSSDYFYNSGLIAHPSVKKQLLRPHAAPIEFIDTAGCGYSEEQDAETLSRINKEEAHLLIRCVEKMIDEIGIETWMEERITMGIITPYRAQVDYLHVLAESSAQLEPQHKFISINTVDAFQGQERDVIAISFVRSNEKADVGFLSDIRRTNVAITRAKKKLILIGDSATLGSNPFYTQLLEYVQGNGFYKSAFEIH
jgi:superfamily I DNA and/or RNA helicase